MPAVWFVLLGLVILQSGAFRALHWSLEHATATEVSAQSECGHAHATTGCSHSISFSTCGHGHHHNNDDQDHPDEDGEQPCAPGDDDHDEHDCSTCELLAAATLQSVEDVEEPWFRSDRVGLLVVQRVEAPVQRGVALVRARGPPRAA